MFMTAKNVRMSLMSVQECIMGYCKVKIVYHEDWEINDGWNVRYLN